MTNDKTHRQPTDGLGDYGRTYLEAVQIIAAALREFSNVVCTPADYRHNAKAILARLAHSDILVEKVNYQPDADNVDNIHADHQSALLKAASLHANMTQPVPGWPVVWPSVITANAADAGYFATMRRNHPVKLGEVINGKRVVETCWHRCQDDGDHPVYRLEGEDGYRLASDLAGRITRPSNPAPITRPAAAESIMPPPAKTLPPSP